MDELILEQLSEFTWIAAEQNDVGLSKFFDQELGFYVGAYHEHGTTDLEDLI